MSTAIGPDVGVVFVSHHSGALIEPRAAHMAAAGAQVVVVNNAGDLAPMPDATVIDNGVNVGFAAACNRGVDALDPSIRVVCFHNPDVDASPASLETLAEAVRGGVGVVGPAMRTSGRVREHGLHYPSPSREVALIARAVRRAGHGWPVAEPTDRARTQRGIGRRFASGALLAVDRMVFTAVGGFDETYFLYAEDLDLWHRIERARHRAVFEPRVIVDHVGAAGGTMDAGTRELLRWLGVEAFVEAFAVGGWRPYRAVHRPFLTRIGADGRLVELVRAAWRTGTPPRATLGALRPELERGDWSGAAGLSRPRTGPSARP
jgi:N-acetylglucosaminyl-diphospho-decaprenol L-rhamnosyltransferase